MDDNTFSNQSNQPNQPDETSQPLEASSEVPPRPQFTSRFRNRPRFQPDPAIDSQSNMSLASGKQHGRVRPAVAGAIGTVCGLAVGAAGIYGLIKFTEQPPICPECDCPNNTSSSINGLDYSFLKLESASDNILYSPLSIRNGLTLLSAGANGNTKTEITNVLGDEEIPKYQNTPDKLSLANGIFIRNTFEPNVSQDYISTVQNDYNAEIMYDDFSSSANMDNWVDQKTFGLIKQIGITPSQDTEMVLANALAIQMGWKYTFDNDDTSGRDFYTKDDTKIEATTMRKETKSEDIKYYQNDEISAISMPLDSETENTNLDFIAIMPTNIDEYIDTVDQSKIDEITNNFIPASEPENGLVLTIPKFKFEYALHFMDDLKSLGINSAFNRSVADFSNMASSPLYVSDALHKANIDFSEEGIKAAAVTAFFMKVTSKADDEPRPIIINIDHPFLFLIRDADNGTIWFTGAVYQPNLWEDNQATYGPSYRESGTEDDLDY